MLASPDSMLNQQQAPRKGSQPILSLDDVLLNSNIRQGSHIIHGAMVNSNPSSNDAFDSEVILYMLVGLRFNYIYHCGVKVVVY